MPLIYGRPPVPEEKKGPQRLVVSPVSMDEMEHRRRTLDATQDATQVSQLQAELQELKKMVLEGARRQNMNQRLEKPEPISDLPTDGTHLIVNGKPRKMGKKSAYLLDMLTLEN